MVVEDSTVKSVVDSSVVEYSPSVVLETILSSAVEVSAEYVVIDVASVTPVVDSSVDSN